MGALGPKTLFAGVSCETLDKSHTSGDFRYHFYFGSALFVTNLAQAPVTSAARPRCAGLDAGLPAAKPGRLYCGRGPGAGGARCAARAGRGAARGQPGVVPGRATGGCRAAALEARGRAPRGSRSGAGERKAPPGMSGRGLEVGRRGAGVRGARPRSRPGGP